MEPDREGRPAPAARHRDTRPGDADLRDADLRDAGLREAWRRRSLARCWQMADDWHSDAVDAVLSACRSEPPAPDGATQADGATQTSGAGRPWGAGRPAASTAPETRGAAPGPARMAAAGDDRLAVACAGLGRSRARAGIGIAETIDDLAALFAMLGPDGGQAGPPLHLVCAIAEGWAEESLDRLAQGGCQDPLSGLATVPYLRTRLAEVYREAEQGGTSPAETHRLLVVRLPRRPDPWHRMALAIGVGQDLRTAFPGGETLSMARPGPAIALVRAGGDLPLRYARLRRGIQGAHGAQVGMTELPGLLADALRLVDELAR